LKSETGGTMKFKKIFLVMAFIISMLSLFSEEKFIFRHKMSFMNNSYKFLLTDKNKTDYGFYEVYYDPWIGIPVKVEDNTIGQYNKKADKFEVSKMAMYYDRFLNYFTGSLIAGGCSMLLIPGTILINYYEYNSGYFYDTTTGRYPYLSTFMIGINIAYLLLAFLYIPLAIISHYKYRSLEKDIFKVLENADGISQVETKDLRIKFQVLIN
jgi:hypothetical protein